MYFPLLCKMEYLSYELMWEYSEVHKAFDKCAKEHLNNQEIRYANVKHFFTLLGKMFFTSYGKEFFTYLGKQIFTS